MKYPETPELDKVSDAQHESQNIGAFIDWLSHGAKMGPRKGVGRIAAVRATKVERLRARGFSNGQLNASTVQLCLFDDDVEEWRPVNLRIEEILARYFDIDLDAVEEERCAVLDYVRRHER